MDSTDNVRRAIVHEPADHEFVDAMVEYAGSLEVGPGIEDPDTGPHVGQSERDETLD